MTLKKAVSFPTVLILPRGRTGLDWRAVHPGSPATVVEGLSREEVRNPGQWQDAQDTDRPAGVLSAARDTKL